MPYDYLNGSRKWTPRRVFKHRVNMPLFADKLAKYCFDWGSLYPDVGKGEVVLQVPNLKRKPRTATQGCQTSDELLKCPCGGTKAWLCAGCHYAVDSSTVSDKEEYCLVEEATEDDTSSVSSLSSSEFILEPKTPGELLLQSLQRSALEAKVSSCSGSSSKFLMSARFLLNKNDFDNSKIMNEPPAKIVEPTEAVVASAVVAQPTPAAAPKLPPNKPQEFDLKLLFLQQIKLKQCPKPWDVIEEETFYTTTKFSDSKGSMDNISNAATYNDANDSCNTTAVAAVNYRASNVKLNSSPFVNCCNGTAMLNSTMSPQNISSARYQKPTTGYNVYRTRYLSDETEKSARNITGTISDENDEVFLMPTSGTFDYINSAYGSNYSKWTELPNERDEIYN